MSITRVFITLTAGIALMQAGAHVPAAQSGDPLRVSYERAQAFQLAGELDRAEAEYRSGVLPRALRRLGNLNGVEGRTDAAIALLEEAAALDAADVEIQTDLAVALLRARDLTRAARVAEAASAAAPRNARARSLLGRILLLQGDAGAAARELRQALSEEGRFDTAHALALASLRLGRVETARALFDQLLSAGANPDIRVLVGRTYLEAGYPREAVAQLSRALQQRPATRRAHYYLGLARLAGEDPDRLAQARENFEAELRLDEAYAPARQALDLLADGRAGELPEAVDSVVLATLPAASSADAPQRATLRAQLTDILRHAWHNLAVIHARRGGTEAAARAAREAEQWTTEAGTRTASAPDAEAALAQADTLLREHRLEEAERATWNALSLVPDLPPAVRLLGLIRAAQKRHEEAEALLRRAVALDPGQQDAWIRLAEVYLAGGEPRRALGVLDRLPVERRNQTAIVRVRSHLALGQVDDARALLQIAAGQAGPEGAAEIVDRLVERDLLTEAETFLASVQPSALLDARLLVASARLRIRQQDTARAEADLGRALAADDRSVDALRMLAALASDRGDDGTATDLLRRARDAAPDAPEVLHELARAAARAARLEEALDAARRLAALRPDDVAARYLLGVTLLQNQEWSEAINTFADPAPDAASDPRWALGLGMAHFGRRDYDAARAAFERTLLLDSGQVEAHYHLGLIAREQGRTADAIVRLEHAVKLAPSHAPALAELGGLHLLQEDYARARDALERAAAIDEDAPGPHYQLGLLYARLGDEQRAQRAMEKFRKAREKMLAAREPL